MRSWARNHVPELAWAVFAATRVRRAGRRSQSWPTVPFHFVWLSLTILYGFRVWGMRATVLVLRGVCAVSTLTLGLDGAAGQDAPRRAHRDPADGRDVPRDGLARPAATGRARGGAARRRARARLRPRRLAPAEDADRDLARADAADAGHRDRRSQAREDLTGLDDELRRLSGIAENLLVLATAEQPDALFLEQVEIEDVDRQRGAALEPRRRRASGSSTCARTACCEPTAAASTPRSTRSWRTRSRRRRTATASSCARSADGRLGDARGLATPAAASQPICCRTSSSAS